MNDQGRSWKWGMLVSMIAMAILFLYPPSKTLKPGIDLAGGTSLLYEIDTTGMTPVETKGLAERVMNILKDRVDPGNQLNLEWRPIGNTRLEIRMPLPTKEAKQRREKYNKTIEAIEARNLTRNEIDLALSGTGINHEVALQELVRGVSKREPIIKTLKQNFDAYQESLKTDNSQAQETARENYEAAVNELLQTSMPRGRLEDVLRIPNDTQRDEELASLREEYPSYAGEENGELIAKAQQAYDDWASDKAALEDPSDLKRMLRGAGVLEFRILPKKNPQNPGKIQAVNNRQELAESIAKYRQQLAKFGPRPRPNDLYRWIEVGDIQVLMPRLRKLSDFEKQKEASQIIFEKYAGNYYVLAHNEDQFVMGPKTGDRKWKLRRAFPTRDMQTGRPVVSFEFDPRGGGYFGELTGSNVQRQLAIVLDGKVMSSANINERITTRGQISGDFSNEDVQYLVNTMSAGSLPSKLKETPLSEKTIGPTLGAQNRDKGISAAIAGFLAVCLFVLIYYGVFAGGMADIALGLNLLFVLAIMALMQATFTLPGIAGLILTVGMAIDANVLIFERYREEREKGVAFRKALNAGYDKALSTIVDANLTTLITCVILGMVSSEEVKGFAIVLGIGIVTSMFTALFVTRLVFNTLISAGILKDMKMFRIISVPKIDWLALRHSFWPISGALVLAGVVAFFYTAETDRDGIFDIEFLGGTSVTLDFKHGVDHDEEYMRDWVTTPDREGPNGESSPSVVDWLNQAGEKLDTLADKQQEADQSAGGAAPAERGDGAGQYTLAWRPMKAGEAAPLTPTVLASLMRPVVSDDLERGGLVVKDDQVIFTTRENTLDFEGFKHAIREAANVARAAADNMRKAHIQKVDTGETYAGTGAEGKPPEPVLSFEVTTVESRRSLVQTALLHIMGDQLLIEQPISFSLKEDEALTLGPYFLIQEDATYLNDVFPDVSALTDIRRFKGGVAIRFSLGLEEKPLTTAAMEKRLTEVRLRSEAEQYGSRDWAVYPLGDKVSLPEGNAYSEFVVVAVDPTIRFADSPESWREDVAQNELALVTQALQSEQTLSKVVQFAGQVATQTQQKTIFGIILALAAIVAYVWLRFGTMQYGLAAIIALVHDVAITLGAVTLSHYIYGTIFGTVLGVSDFKINLPMIAAILTVIGYSLNDTIVVFDRIRENRGKLGTLSDTIINNSLNQTLSRTLLTSITTFLVVFIMYVWGGEGIKGFSFALLIGVVVGTYSSLGIATPLLFRPARLNTVALAIGWAIMVGVSFALTDDQLAALVLSAVLAVIFFAAGFYVNRGIIQPRRSAPSPA